MSRPTARRIALGLLASALLAAGCGGRTCPPCPEPTRTASTCPTAGAETAQPAAPPSPPPFEAWREGPREDGSYPVAPFVEHVRRHRPELLQDPLQAALVATGFSAKELREARIEVRYHTGDEQPAPELAAEQAAVVLTEDGLMDDAIAARRWTLGFESTGTPGEWQLSSAALACRGGRPGSAPGFSAEACFGP